MTSTKLRKVNNDVHATGPLAAKWGYLPMGDQDGDARPGDRGLEQKRQESQRHRGLVAFLQSLSVWLLITIAVCLASIAVAPRPADFNGPDELRHAALGRMGE